MKLASYPFKPDNAMVGFNVDCLDNIERVISY